MDTATPTQFRRVVAAFVRRKTYLGIYEMSRNSGALFLAALLGCMGVHNVRRLNTGVSRSEMAAPTPVFPAASTRLRPGREKGVLVWLNSR